MKNAKGNLKDRKGLMAGIITISEDMKSNYIRNNRKYWYKGEIDMRKTERKDRNKTNETRGFLREVINVSNEMSKKRNFRQFWLSLSAVGKA